MKKVAGLFLLCSFAAVLFAAGSARADDAPAADADGYLQALHPRTWSFPRDHGRHEGFKTEWWYFTGNLADGSGRQFGYQLTFFRTALAPKAATRPSAWRLTNLYFAHAAVSDVQNRAFHFKDRLSREHAGLAESSDQTLDVRLLDWSASLKENVIHLHEAENDFAIDLTCSDGRGPTMQGPGGVNAKGRRADQASYYYSMTRLKTTGSITVGGKVYDVHGQTWMDHEFSSNALSPDQVGWDWMGLSLDNGDDLMIYRMRNRKGGTDFLSGTLIPPQGPPRYLSERDITLESSSPWTSPQTNASYPQRWKVTIGGLGDFDIRSKMVGQELHTNASTKVDYFEGAVDVLDSHQKAVGQGYLEMTGYQHALGGI